MYEYMKGRLSFVSPSYLAVEVGGIGYQLFVANPFRFSSKFNEEILIYVHQAVREDAITLYGFADLDEKQLFLKLISVSGIGPKSALAILASDDHGGLVNAIETDDAGYLTKFPGVGKKTAQQIVLDLKGKLGELSTTAAATEKMEASPVVSATKHMEEALEALKALGYSAKELKRIEPKLKLVEATSTDEYLRTALKLLMKK
ncbi:Holliday junction branch migration protein RuvA [Isobaculum melis]|uniref:Holliday junction branch migration complex subunit RuvA n=1 Tax=Isobaculum melis TaxID=142588 RepID=A0A1H9RLG4_9LACT|nr:Holliday junction branch migration protein RuvA [Isobaculum melis]SER73428.1 Holliday junction DNA helicase subunit RuvA [Isobaculum melis]